MKCDLEKNVTNLWFRVCAKEKDAYLMSHNNTIGKGNIGDYAYNSFFIQNESCLAQLNEFLEELDLEHDELYFYDLLKNKNGESWTEFHQKLDFFASMLNAIGILEYVEEPTYTIGKNNNPKIKILKREKEYI